MAGIIFSLVYQGFVLHDGIPNWNMHWNKEYICAVFIRKQYVVTVHIFHLCLTGKGAQSCDSCHMGYSLVEGACVSQCIMGEYPVVEVKFCS